MRSLRIAVDAMGGDRGPEVVVRGAVDFLREAGSEGCGDVSLVLVGEGRLLEGMVRGAGGSGLPLSVRHAGQVIGMDEHPAEALKAKPDSSIAVTAGLQRAGEVEASVSPGNTGAMMAASLFALGRIEGISRPAIAATFPTLLKPAVVLDVGANVGCKPEHLLQFALMGSAYSRGVFGIPEPRVALLNVGGERTKGTPTEQQAYGLLESSGLNFQGNIEGDGVFQGDADVIVCDGFTGNILLKSTESIADLIGGALFSEMKRHWYSRAGFLLMRPAFSRLWKRLDAAEYGGAPLLGLNGISIIAHGNSGAKAIRNAISAACGFFRSNVNLMISEGLKVAAQGEIQ